jgi:hypothetical protein
LPKPKGPKKKLELLTGKITELKKKEKDVGDGPPTAEYTVIEQAINGYILRMVAPSSEEGVMIEAVFVFDNKEDLIELLKDNI